MKYLQATQIKADITARIIIADNRLQTPYILTIRLLSLSRNILAIIKFIWLLVLHCQIVLLKTKAKINQITDSLINWLLQPILIPAWIPVPEYARI